MTEKKEDEFIVDEQDLKPQATLSPTSINVWYKCPRQYFYTYIARLKVKPTIELVKGSIIHKVLEEFYEEFKPDLREHLINTFYKVWSENKNRVRELEVTQDIETHMKADAINILLEYYNSIKRKIDMYKFMGKAEDDYHGFYLLKPKFREKYITDPDLKLCGYIDRVNIDFDGLITIGDYKTSNKFGIGFPIDYKRQLALYSLLYRNKEKVTPDFAAVIFLRFGEEYLLEVTPSLLRYAQETADEVYRATRSTNIKDYPMRESNLCRWCPFYDICSNKVKWEERLRLERMEDLIKDEDIKKESGEKEDAD